MTIGIHEQQEALDLEVQHQVTEKILKAEESGRLIGSEAPVYRCHTFIPTKAGETYARSITRQLNHLAEALGVLGFQVLYREDSFNGDNRPDSGYFQIRVFANNGESNLDEIEPVTESHE